MESENTTASIAFNAAAFDTSFIPIANFASPLFTISITISSIEDTSASLLVLMICFIAAERRNTNIPSSPATSMPSTICTMSFSRYCLLTNILKNLRLLSPGPNIMTLSFSPITEETVLAMSTK
jgi:hypothetical protein